MNLSRGIAILPIAVALGLTASAQTADVDSSAKPTRVRQGAPVVVQPSTDAVEIATNVFAGNVQAPVQSAPAVGVVSAGQASEVDPFGAPSDPVPGNGSTKAIGYSWNNGPFVTGFGDGFGGANTSAIETGFNTFGYGMQGGTINNRIADDFVVGAGKTVTLDTIVWRTYQTGGTTAGSITGLNANIWNTTPLTGNLPDQTGPNNSFVSQVWSGAYRVTSTTLLTNNRPIIDVTGDLSWVDPLNTGSYWADVTLTGSLASGPWGNPTVPAQPTDNAQQFIGSTATWGPIIDAVAQLPQDMPFALSGKAFSSSYCYSNGQFINGFGNGFNGADTSILTNGTIFGYGAQGGTINNRVADDFPVGVGQVLAPQSLVFRFYQTGGTTAGSMTGINVNLWNTDPVLGGAASQVGPANAFMSQVWSGAYRVTSTTLLSNNRPIIDVTGDLSWANPLVSGTHWVDVTATGSLASGPWAIPTVPETFGNGRQSVAGGLFAAIVDDFPFDVCGLLFGDGCAYNNGGFVTGIGNGAGGANTSVITNGTLFGYGTQGGTINNRIADDFTVPAGDTWGLQNLSWKLYQTGAPTTGTITGLNVNLWNADPALGGAASQTGPANAYLSQVWTGCYRVTSTNLLDPGRAIIDVSGDMSWATPVVAGQYWVDVTATGSLASGPWSPPTVPETFGNGRQSVSGGTFAAVVDDFPFALTTLCTSEGPEIYCTAKTHSCGSVPTIGGPAGITSQATSGAGTFDVTCGPVNPGSFGIMIYSTDGKLQPPLTTNYGLLCIGNTFRVNPPSTGAVGGPCAATYTFDFGTYLATQSQNPALTPAGLALSGGAIVDMQVWYRDNGFPPPGNANFSNAMRFIVLP